MALGSAIHYLNVVKKQKRSIEKWLLSLHELNLTGLKYKSGYLLYPLL